MRKDGGCDRRLIERGLGHVVGGYKLFDPSDQLLDAGGAASPDCPLGDDPVAEGPRIRSSNPPIVQRGSVVERVVVLEAETLCPSQDVYLACLWVQ